MPAQPREPILSKRLTSKDKWKWGLAIAALFLAGPVITNYVRPDREGVALDASAPESATAAGSSRLAPEEATNIYNNYIAAARLCRSAGESGIRAISADPVTAYETLLRAKETCDESANRISDKRASDAFAADTVKKLDHLRSECVSSHRLLARVYGKIANLIDKGASTSQLVETRDLLNQGRDAEEYCHATLAEAIKEAGGQVMDR